MWLFVKWFSRLNVEKCLFWFILKSWFIQLKFADEMKRAGTAHFKLERFCEHDYFSFLFKRTSLAKNKTISNVCYAWQGNFNSIVQYLWGPGPCLPNGTAHFIKCKKLFEYKHLLLLGGQSTNLYLNSVHFYHQC